MKETDCSRAPTMSEGHAYLKEPAGDVFEKLVKRADFSGQDCHLSMMNMMVS